MNKVILLFGSVLILVATLGFSSNADATTALCVGCTSNSQFQGAAWQAFGDGYTQGADILVINPDTGLSKWVHLEHLAPGTGRNSVPVSRGVGSESQVQPGVATPVQPNSGAAIYIARDQLPQLQANFSSGIKSAYASDVSIPQQIDINTAIAVTKKTYFVQLNPSTFPSYSGSLPILIANANFTALQQVPGVNWPVSAFSGSAFKALLKIMGVYTGHSFMVCDVFGNGDSACFEPDPQSNNVLVQNGPAKNVNGQALSDISNRVAGGGGGGMGVRQSFSPREMFYEPPSSSGHIVCGYVNGQLSTCIKVF